MNDENRPPEQRPGKKITFTSLTAAEYAAKFGASLIVVIPLAKSPESKASTPSKTLIAPPDTK